MKTEQRRGVVFGREGRGVWGTVAGAVRGKEFLGGKLYGLGLSETCCCEREQIARHSLSCGTGGGMTQTRGSILILSIPIFCGLQGGGPSLFAWN